ncbi:TetR family transcriptional regulator [Syntrophotalea acetylenica]|jgi:TetR/AcrR family acrAB operon transcriptional repressor|uniref:TetR family transcriptional regulator n=1 Tax=Syntrophotalea TaxID=2812025 RepID=UPI002A35DD4E|nr:TetR family transcriptional regulator [Syntrophotalea acetylenica]MDY0261650.1 TetR family transcriptional regulator [Syntrophotalea acetylenica]
MARKTREESEQTRQDILNVALDLFHARGYARTTLEQIARGAGVTRGAIYWHFKDKVDLFLGLKEDVERSTETRLEDLLLRTVNELSDMRDNLLRLFRCLENDERSRKYFELIFFRAEYTEELQPIMDQFRLKLQRLEQKDAEDFARLQQAGIIAARHDGAQIALALRCLVLGLLHTWLINVDEFQIVRKGGELIEQYLESLRG